MSKEKKGLPIISLAEKQKKGKSIKGLIIGEAGIGKTTLLNKLNPKTTLFIDVEAGDLAVRGWRGKVLSPQTWEGFRDLACFFGGVDVSMPLSSLYSKEHYEKVCNKFGDPKDYDQYTSLFIDSLTAIGRICFNWCKNEKIGGDGRAVYGLFNQELTDWLIRVQRIQGKHIWFVGILDRNVEESGKVTYSLQMNGKQIANTLEGIIDEIITYAFIKVRDKKTNEPTLKRAFICNLNNKWGYPAKDRAGCLNMIEPPNLALLMEKLTKPLLVSERKIDDSLEDINKTKI